MATGNMFDRVKNAAKDVRNAAYKAGGGRIDEDSGVATGT
jgi:hypothetical protein